MTNFDKCKFSIFQRHKTRECIEYSAVVLLCDYWFIDVFEGRSAIYLKLLIIFPYALCSNFLINL